MNVERLGSRSSDLASDLSLQHWANQAIADSSIRAALRQRGQTLHVWCQGSPCPNVAQMTSAFSQAIYQTPMPTTATPIARVMLYGSRVAPDEPKAAVSGDAARTSPEWTVRLEVPSRSQQRPQPQRIDPPPDQVGGLAQTVEQALAQTLADLGQSVDQLRISVRKLASPRSGNEMSGITDKRLWVLCESDYIPDSARLVRPIATRLRELNLHGFRDAVLVGQVSGEIEPEWAVRIDLTPPDHIVRRWAQWGDVAAIAHSMAQALAPLGLQISAMLRDATLHVVCSPQGEVQGKAQSTAHIAAEFPGRDAVLARIQPVLTDLSPRGISGATVYGLDQPYEASFPVPSSPQWVTWLDLPAMQHPDLNVSAMDLAQAGNLNALCFLLDRLLNPDLRDKLTTGGQHVELRRRQDWLQIMIEAPIAPDRDHTCAIVDRLIKQVEATDLLGVQLYGRRSGQRQPDWQHSIELQAYQAGKDWPTTVQMQETHPTAYHADDLDNRLEPDAMPQPFPTPVVVARPQLQRSVRRVLCAMGVVMERPDSPDATFEPSVVDTPRRSRTNLSTALVWGTIGLVLTVQTDWIASELLQRQATREALIRGAAAASDRPREDATLPDWTQAPLAESDPIAPIDSDANGFDDRGFTTTDRLPANTPHTSQAIETIQTSFPTLNSEQMDRQVALYDQYIQDFGIPDVLIVGSSRALRGIDPSALETALTEVGHSNLRVFNLGVNGATAQVIEFLLTELLAADQLPKLVLWADGARAFNSGREDRTYEAIAQSPGYASVLDGFRPIASQAPSQTPNLSFFDSVGQRYRDLNDRLTRGFSDHSATYAQREQLRQNLRDFAVARLQGGDQAARLASASAASSQALGNAALYRNGFLAFADEFAPQDYYERYTYVPGSYDLDYDAFELRGVQSISLTNVADVLRSRQIKLVFVNLPMTDAYLDDTRRSYENAFSAYMLRMSKTLDFAFRDFGQLWPQQNDYFSDPSHLNRYGAEAVAVRLAQSPMIPWETLAEGEVSPVTESTQSSLPLSR